MFRKTHSNLAARMGRWSAAHWKTATFGWLAFVVVVFMLGAVVGTKNIDQDTAGPGESGRMDKILEAAFKQPAAEHVLIQNRSLRVGTAAFDSAIADVVSRGRSPQAALEIAAATSGRSVLISGLTVMVAAYGVLVLVFQRGLGKGLLGVSSADGIDAVVPLLLFVILFGLSMDYHVFILSRIRETFDRGKTMDEAVSHGIKSTAGVVTSAALVMVSVFAVFATLSWPFFKEFGVGLAVAVLIDATIVRAVLLPATMKLLGDWNWYLPRWLDWLPRLEHYEPEPTSESTHEVKPAELPVIVQ
jgi:uncharacterized membrane protein YdfJ with MMPL/SSD domain